MTEFRVSLNPLNLGVHKVSGRVRMERAELAYKASDRGCDKLTAMLQSDAVQILEGECFDEPNNLEHIYLANVRIIGDQA